MNAEIIGTADTNIVTLAEFNRLLDRLSLNGRLEVDESGDVTFYLDGEIRCYNVPDELVSAIIEVFDEFGIWPEINVFDSAYDVPDEQTCKKMLAELDHDYQAFWNWLKSEIEEAENGQE